MYTYHHDVPYVVYRTRKGLAMGKRATWAYASACFFVVLSVFRFMLHFMEG